MSPASIAPGTTSITALSTTSMTAIEAVSAASATFSAVRRSSPDRTTLRTVSAYPKTNARTTASTTVARLCQPSQVPMTIPRTSPIAQPVRQCNVAWAAIDQVAEGGLGRVAGVHRVIVVAHGRIIPPGVYPSRRASTRHISGGTQAHAEESST